MPGFLVRVCLLLALESAAVLLLSDAGVPWIPVLLGVFVLGSAVPHGTAAEFAGRFLVACVAVGATLAGAAAWEAYGEPVTDPGTWAARAATAVLLLFQTATLMRLSLRRA
ncbi:hypothetical protein OOK31_22920 [Streptomyces sp. NBC_00249]|uniref:hypothetical protein n=1 Tax=Streptomyces sp. NBC_00249 TaxID=2975690 RepID=UPI00225129B1|nr:hypothetical protein [Streptomyces sp. NBC_00249]MCX5196710.1 hypothetical protein [Streptomyces sp. NBC_00249]